MSSTTVHLGQGGARHFGGELRAPELFRAQAMRPRMCAARGASDWASGLTGRVLFHAAG
jgi:hypothetical protein